MTRKLLLLKLLLLMLFVWCAVPNARAACTLSAFSTLNFSTYTGALINSTATATVSGCARNDGWNIPLDAGNGAGATITNRLMTGPGGRTLKYALFQDSARTINWGNTTATQYSGTGNTTVTVYGQVAANQYPTPGTYTDSVDSATRTLTVTATVQAACTVSASSLAFGTYTGAQVDSSATITATCTNTTPYNVGLNAGTSTGATVSTRRMTGPSGALLNYNLFRDTGRTLNWGTTIGTDTVAGTGNGAAQSLTVYGRIPAGQYPAPGNYTDTINVTITY